jgi:DNA-binding MarR family transcriptional regulator
LLIDEYFAAFKVNAIKFMPASRAVDTKRRDAERLADIFTVLQRCFILNLCKELSRGHVSFPQYCLLGFLREQKELNMSEIAHRMGHSTAAATGLIDRLENLGHVKRTHGRDDRRKVLVQITASGAALVAEVREDMITNLLKMMEVLDPDEQKTWLQIYEKISTYCQSK